MNYVDEQKALTKIALGILSPFGFALAGSGAIREHGITSRPTHDIDLFSIAEHDDEFGNATKLLAQELSDHGYVVELVREYESFARFVVTTPAGSSIEIDMALDYRSAAPVSLAVGPVLALPDAVGNKIAALYSRGEARDFIDMCSIRESGRYSDNELLDLALKSDPGFDVEMFARQLIRVTRLELDEVSDYELDAEGLARVKTMCVEWAHELTFTRSQKPSNLGRSAYPPAVPPTGLDI